MQITSLGHAGFLVRTNDDAILCDPWLSTGGAFAGSWSQFPENKHLDVDGLEVANYLYISHMHLDHYDKNFLASRSNNFKECVQVVLASFLSKRLFGGLKKLGYKKIIELRNNETLNSDTGTTLFIQSDESPLHQDSALTINDGTHTFVNANDCKLISQQEAFLKNRYKQIDVLAMQFSGATFHPACYDYSPEVALQIARQRKTIKMTRVADSIKRLGVKTYLPSAGPPCFLLPELYHLNNPEGSIFNWPNQIKDFLCQNGTLKKTKFVLLAPGDSIDAGSGKLDRVTDLSDRYLSRSYLEYYQKRRLKDLENERDTFKQPVNNTLKRAKEHFRGKLNSVPELAHIADCLLTIELTGDQGGVFTINMRDRSVHEGNVKLGNKQQSYTLTLETTWMQAILEKRISWEEFYLSLQFHLHRDPDYHNEPLNAFLWLESKQERLAFLEYRRRIMNLAEERVRRSFDGKIIEYNRYCPHKGEDLADAPIQNGQIICTRHGWTFHAHDGSGLNNPCSLNVKEVI